MPPNMATMNQQVLDLKVWDHQKHLWEDGSICKEAEGKVTELVSHFHLILTALAVPFYQVKIQTSLLVSKW